MRAPPESSATARPPARALLRPDGQTPRRAQIDGLAGVGPDDGSVDYVVAAFVNSYIVIAVWILLQVSVAVLLVTSPKPRRTGCRTCTSRLVPLRRLLPGLLLGTAF